MLQKITMIKPCSTIYLATMALTLLTWQLSYTGLSGLHLSMLVLLLSVLKAHLIGDFFMGLRTVNSIWRWAIVIWLTFAATLIATAFILAV